MPAVVGVPLARLYGAVVAHRNRRFDRGIGVERLPVPVVSVGNVSVGGTGKTPMVIHLVARLREHGLRPCVAMRGYVRSFRMVAPAQDQAERSDEARLYREALPGVPVVAQADRGAGVRALLARGATIDCVVLDDGFQHRRLARDLDVVLTDASRPPFDDRLLPAGWLREPVESLRRAGAVVVTHAEMVSSAEAGAMARRAAALAPGAVVAVARHAWVGVRIGEADAQPLSWLRGRRVLAVCAIGNPGAFLRGAIEAGAEVADRIVLPDHDPYRHRTARTIVRRARACGAAAILTTDKDWAKLRECGASARGGEWPCPVARPRLEIRFDSGERALEQAVLRAARGAGRGFEPGTTGIGSTGAG